MRAPSVPRLLVSVRDPDEALAARRGGAHIVDMKDPARGPLGRPDRATLEGIEQRLKGDCPDLPLSVALGEVADALEEPDQPLPDGLTYAKFGLSRLAAAPHWVDDWQRMRGRIERATHSHLKWVAVIYADGANAPPADDIIQAASQTGCAGLLVDTFDKQAGGVRSFCTPDQLAGWCRLARQQRLFFAVAGRLTLDDLTWLPAVTPDIIAIRSAACLGRDRQQAVSEQQVRHFAQALARAFAAEGLLEEQSTRPTATTNS